MKLKSALASLLIAVVPAAYAVPSYRGPALPAVPQAEFVPGPAVPPAVPARAAKVIGMLTAAGVPVHVAAPPAPARRIPGKVGVVVYYNARIYDGPYRRQVYNVLQPGDNVILIGYNTQYYGVKMVDGRMGWMPKQYVHPLADTILVDAPAPRQHRGFDPSTLATDPLLETAYKFMGIPYRWGGQSRWGIDCSGFVQAVFRAHGVELPRVARDQARVGSAVPGVPVSLDNLQKGDRLYFACHHSYIDHTGIYIENGYFIHSSGGRGVGISHLPTEAVYRNGLVAARRL